MRAFQGVWRALLAMRCQIGPKSKTTPSQGFYGDFLERGPSQLEELRSARAPRGRRRRRRKPQEAAGSRRRPQETAGSRRKPQEAVGGALNLLLRGLLEALQRAMKLELHGFARRAMAVFAEFGFDLDFASEVFARGLAAFKV